MSALKAQIPNNNRSFYGSRCRALKCSIKTLKAYPKNIQGFNHPRFQVQRYKTTLNFRGTSIGTCGHSQVQLRHTWNPSAELRMQRQEAKTESVSYNGTDHKTLASEA